MGTGEAAWGKHVGGNWHLGPCGYAVVADRLVINIGGGGGGRCPGGAISVGLGGGLASFGL